MTSTSSFRIDDELKQRLELVARRTNEGKNRIINKALQEYLSRHDQTDLKQEAVRQSQEAARLAQSANSVDETHAWEELAAEVWNG